MAKKAAGKKAGKPDKKGKKNTPMDEVKSAKSVIKVKAPVPVVCQSNRYPGILKEPSNLSVMGLKSATYEGLCELLTESFKQTDRALLITPWGAYVVFREFNGEEPIFFLYDGCSCVLNIFRYYDLKLGTAGLLYFQTYHEIITYILENRLKKEKYKRLDKTSAIDRLCRKFCSQGGGNIYKICNRRGEICSLEDHIIRQCLFPRIKERCDKNSIGSIERELPSMKNQRLFKRVLEGKKSNKPKLISCK